MSDPVVLDLTADDTRSGAEFWLDWAKGAEWRFASYYKYTFTFTAAGGLLIYRALHGKRALLQYCEILGTYGSREKRNQANYDGQFFKH